MDYAEGDSTTSVAVATYQNRVNYDYGLAGYDRPNILTFHFLYDLPKLSRIVPNKIVGAVFDGWQISDITTFESGAPTTISLTTSPTALLGGGDPVRTLMVGNPNGPKTFDDWFNVAAFAAPSAPGYQAACLKGACPALTLQNIGDAPQMPIRGPGVNNWNTSLFKNFTIRERWHFTFRAEAYNTFNHPQWSA